jgi:hypothetical protein
MSLLRAKHRFFRAPRGQLFQHLVNPRLRWVRYERLRNRRIGTGQTAPVAYAGVAGAADIGAPVRAYEPINRRSWSSSVVTRSRAIPVASMQASRKGAAAGKALPDFDRGGAHAATSADILTRSNLRWMAEPGSTPKVLLSACNLLMQLGA